MVVYGIQFQNELSSVRTSGSDVSKTVVALQFHTGSHAAQSAACYALPLPPPLVTKQKRFRENVEKGGVLLLISSSYAPALLVQRQLYTWA